MPRRRHKEHRLTPLELAEALAMPLAVVTKAGALRNGSERGHGSIWHIVPGEPCDGRSALCGARPSIMWTTWGKQEATCKTCKKLIDQHYQRETV